LLRQLEHSQTCGWRKSCVCNVARPRPRIPEAATSCALLLPASPRQWQRLTAQPKLAPEMLKRSSSTRSSPRLDAREQRDRNSVTVLSHPHRIFSQNRPLRGGWPWAASGQWPIVYACFILLLHPSVQPRRLHMTHEARACPHGGTTSCLKRQHAWYVHRGTYNSQVHTIAHIQHRTHTFSLHGQCGHGGPWWGQGRLVSVQMRSKSDHENAAELLLHGRRAVA